MQLQNANFLMMDEYNTGMDPEMKRYFKKILNSFSFGAMWLIGMATLGIFFQLAVIKNRVQWYNALFYIILLVSLWLLIRYYYRQWK